MSNYVISYRRKLDTLSTCRQAIERATKAAESLARHEDLPPVDCIRRYSVEWLDLVIEPHKRAIKEDKSLTAAERAGRLELWRNIRKTAKPWVCTIQAVLRDWPEVKWQRGSDGLFFVPSGEVERIGEEASVVEIPELAKEHLNRAKELLKAVADFRLWEHENLLTHPRLQVLAEIRDYDFYLAHVDGMFAANYGPGNKYLQNVDTKQITRIF